jgi:hypothetical protein
LALEEMVLPPQPQILQPKEATLFLVLLHQLAAALVCVRALIPRRMVVQAAAVDLAMVALEQVLLALRDKVLTAVAPHIQVLVAVAALAPLVEMEQ